MTQFDHIPDGSADDRFGNEADNGYPDGFTQFDDVFTQAARGIRPSPGHSQDGVVPYAMILRGANIGFEPAMATQVLAHDSWLVYLNRLWDAQRVDGVPIGEERVPEMIWDLAAGDDETARLHQRLLEETGMRLPHDIGQQLSLHLALWELAPAMRDGLNVEASARCDGPVRLDVHLVPDGVSVTVDTDIPGQFEIVLRWDDGSTIRCETDPLDGGSTWATEVPAAVDTLPTSTTIRRGALS